MRLSCKRWNSIRNSIWCCSWEAAYWARPHTSKDKLAEQQRELELKQRNLAGRIRLSALQQTKIQLIKQNLPTSRYALDVARTTRQMLQSQKSSNEDNKIFLWTQWMCAPWQKSMKQLWCSNWTQGLKSTWSQRQLTRHKVKRKTNSFRISFTGHIGENVPIKCSCIATFSHRGQENTRESSQQHFTPALTTTHF